jgi:hypothetical protein
MTPPRPTGAYKKDDDDIRNVHGALFAGLLEGS